MCQAGGLLGDLNLNNILTEVLRPAGKVVEAGGKVVRGIGNDLKMTAVTGVGQNVYNMGQGMADMPQ